MAARPGRDGWPDRAAARRRRGAPAIACDRRTRARAPGPGVAVRRHLAPSAALHRPAAATVLTRTRAPGRRRSEVRFRAEWRAAHARPADGHRATGGRWRIDPPAGGRISGKHAVLATGGPVAARGGLRGSGRRADA